MTSIQDDIKIIHSLTDLSKILNKRSYRGRRITQIYDSSKTIFDLDLGTIDPVDLDKKNGELIKHSLIYEATQERFEELSLEKEAFNWDEESAHSQTIRDEHQAIIRKFEILKQRVQLYDTGLVLLEAYDSLSTSKSLASSLVAAELTTLKSQVSEYKRALRLHADHHELEEIRRKLVALSKEVEDKVASAQADSKIVADTPITMEVKPKTSKLKVSLPTFDGSSLDWRRFHDLFKAIVDKDPTLTDGEKSSLLINAMANEEAKELVKASTLGSDGYNQGLEALRIKYGRDRIVYREHLSALTTGKTFGYNQSDLLFILENWSTHLRGLKDCRAMSSSCILAAQLEDQFGKELSHQWSLASEDSDTPPTIEKILEFVKSRLNTAPKKLNNSTTQSKHHNTATRFTRTVMKVTTTAALTCSVCSSSEHGLSKCPTFLCWDQNMRYKHSKETKRCLNCLSQSHNTRNCTSTFNCRHCGSRHHSLLHRELESTKTMSNNPGNESTTPKAIISLSRINSSTARKDNEPNAIAPRRSFLITALANATNGSHQYRVRILMDPGAETSLITEKLASDLRLHRYSSRLHIEGITGGEVSKYYVELNLCSIHSDSQERLTVSCYIIPRLPYVTPPQNPESILQSECLQGNIPLADPALGGKVDILLGSVDVNLCSLDKRSISKNHETIATNTIFGWTITGPAEPAQRQVVLKVQVKEDPLQSTLEQLWEIERVPEMTNHSPEDELALQHFEDTYLIQPGGRYSVLLPRLEKPPCLGSSRNIALRRFLQNERSLQSKGTLQAFNEVMCEYITLNHAELVPANELNRPDNEVFYLPIHGVSKESSTTTKLRAVFDASAHSSTGHSLNDLLLTGPNLYPLLTTILHRFRLHKIAYSADISKMFREIALQDQDKDLHRFLLRDADGHIKDYRMRRLTFGVKSSPFLATRVLRHIAETHLQSCPQASEAILNSFYVDDFLSGAANLRDADVVRQELCLLLQNAGMTLRKWRSNSPSFLSTIPEELKESADLHLPSPLSSSKALGMHWDVRNDNFHVSVPQIDSSIPVTKRLIASESAKVFDILGLFSPCILPSKVILQDLWKHKLDWDQPVPEPVSQRWQQWASSLHLISKHAIQRRLTPSDVPPISQSLHGFSDASTSAYGAAVYLRTVHEDATVTVTLVTSKARVAPLKATTIPRMELIAAYLLAKLLSSVSSDLNVPITQIHAWTDSTIVLCWLRKAPTSLKTFVSHRVSAINQLVPSEYWKHVSTQHNPADLASRGVNTSALVSSSLWWEGPFWLKDNPVQWPATNYLTPSSLPELKATIAIVKPKPPANPLWSKFSSFNKLIRVMAWVRRFLNNARLPTHQRSLSDVLRSSELQTTKNHLLRTSQEETFSDILDSLRNGRNLPCGHSLSKLDVSMNTNKLLCVSGRVRDTASPKLPKTLILLSLKSPLTQLFLSTLHVNCNHPGICSLLSIVAETYHIAGLRNHIKLISRQCSTCQKAYARPLSQKMGLLPTSRTEPAPPFYRTGMDFAGPFVVRQGYTRKPIPIKTYACLFVCLTTRAIHIELCADLTTKEFIAALRRFCARRGTPLELYSDNGSNFIGAKKEIMDVQRLLQSNSTTIALSHFSTETSVQWHHIPPRAPHFGGLWEAGVKGMKTALRKLLTPHLLMFHELTTILAEAESILNSRPLWPLHSSDPEDPLVLTAGHFLIGRPLKSPPTPGMELKSDISRLKRWNLVRRLTQDLWTTWKARYLQSLNARSKWHRKSYNLKIGDIVLLKEEFPNQQRWPLAKVTRVFTGDDNLVRTVDLRCQGKTYRRAVNRLILITEDQPSPQYVWVQPDRYVFEPHSSLRGHAYWTQSTVIPICDHRRTIGLRNIMLPRYICLLLCFVLVILFEPKSIVTQCISSAGLLPIRHSALELLVVN